MTFNKAIINAQEKLYRLSHKVEGTRWQSVDVSKKPGLATYEVLNHSFTEQVYTEDLEVLRTDIHPNLPWADDHFLERVGGQPLNPGIQWAHWPYGHSADKFRTEKMRNGEQGFSHTYMERMWPKHAGIVHESEWGTNMGIRYCYGDAMDVVHHLAKDPDSRQAYLPIWFPEDTGKMDVRVPCTLGYHFIHRRGYLHCTYYIRSVDFVRHFRDDIYLTVRLQLWMLDQLRKLGGDCEGNADTGGIDHNQWQHVKPGMFTMHIVSLHMFENDFHQIFGKRK